MTRLGGPFGGIPGRDADDLLESFDADLDDVLQSGEIAGMQIDQSKCFDRVSHEMCVNALCHLGMSSKLATGIKKFYANVQVWFAGKDFVLPEAVRRTHGLLQGCPCSMLMLAAAMSIWTWQLKAAVPRIKSGSYVDDRILWATHPERVADLKIAKDLTWRFHVACKWRWNEGKVVLFASDVAAQHSMKQQLSDVGAVKQEFEYLGIEYTTDRVRRRGRRWRFKAPRLAKTHRRLRRIARCCSGTQRKLALISKLVIPVIRWGARWRTNSELDKVAVAIERAALNGKVWRGRSLAITWINVLGPRCHPSFVHDWEALSAHIRTLRKSYCKTGSMQCGTGRLPQACENWRWTLVSDRVLRTQLGDIDITCLSKFELMRHAAIGWMTYMLGRDNRAKSVLDNGPCMRVLSGHATYFDTAKNWMARWIAVGSCPDHRNFDEINGAQSLKCFCGQQRQPTRRHWMWHCGEENMEPSNDAEEALGITCIDCPRPHAIRALHIIPHIEQCLAAQPGSSVCAVTDGSVFEGRAAGWAVGFMNAQLGIEVRKGRVGGGDQTSWAAEVEAVSMAIQANVRAQKHLHLVIDCLNVVDTLKMLADWIIHMRCTCPLPRYGFGRWIEILESLRRQPAVTAEWIPSHQKKSSWQPEVSTFGGAADLRRANDEVDVAAKASAKAFFGTCRWRRHLAQHTDAENRAIANLRKLHQWMLQYLARDDALVQHYSWACEDRFK